MLVYHGSYVAVKAPDIAHSRNNIDFGKGFYVTPFQEQAESWARRQKDRKGIGVVSIYDLREECFSQVRVMKFEKYTEEWLDYITKCRDGKDEGKYDVIMGGIANDKIFNTIELYFDELIDKKEAIKRLSFEEPNLQICIHSQKVIDRFLQYVGSEEV